MKQPQHDDLTDNRIDNRTLNNRTLSVKDSSDLAQQRQQLANLVGRLLAKHWKHTQTASRD